MRNKGSAALDPDLEAIPEWKELAVDLRQATKSPQDWAGIRMVASRDEASVVVPILLKSIHNSKSPYLRFKVAMSFKTSLLRPWTDEILSWLKREQDPFVKGALADSLTACSCKENALEIWNVVKTIPNLEGDAPLLAKLHKSGWLGDAVAKWIEELHRNGKLDASLKKMADSLGILRLDPPVPSSQMKWNTRLASTKLFGMESESEGPLNVDLSSLRSHGLFELDSLEVDIDGLIEAIEGLEAKYNCRINVGQDLCELMRDWSSEGVLVQVENFVPENERTLALYCMLEDVDTVTLRLIGIQ